MMHGNTEVKFSDIRKNRTSSSIDSRLNVGFWSPPCQTGSSVHPATYRLISTERSLPAARTLVSEAEFRGLYVPWPRHGPNRPDPTRLGLLQIIPLARYVKYPLPLPRANLISHRRSICVYLILATVRIFTTAQTIRGAIFGATTSVSSELSSSKRALYRPLTVKNEVKDNVGQNTTSLLAGCQWNMFRPTRGVIIRFTMLTVRDYNVSSGCWDLIIMPYKVYMRKACL